MSNISDVPAHKPNLGVRGLIMLLMAFILHISVTVLFFMAAIQYILALLNDKPNDRLMAFGRNFAIYIQQIVAYLSFASDQAPFPFSDWPQGQ